MDIIKTCAEHLHKGLCDLMLQDTDDDIVAYTGIRAVISAEVHIFNACTVMLIASVALGILGILSPLFTCILGGCALTGRAIAYQSFEPILSNFRERPFDPRITIPTSVCFADRTVIFYQMPSREISFMNRS